MGKSNEHILKGLGEKNKILFVRMRIYRWAEWMDGCRGKNVIDECV